MDGIEKRIDEKRVDNKKKKSLFTKVVNGAHQNILKPITHSGVLIYSGVLH